MHEIVILMTTQRDSSDPCGLVLMRNEWVSRDDEMVKQAHIMSCELSWRPWQIDHRLRVVAVTKIGTSGCWRFRGLWRRRILALAPKLYASRTSGALLLTLNLPLLALETAQSRLCVCTSCAFSFTIPRHCNVIQLAGLWRVGSQPTFGHLCSGKLRFWCLLAHRR